MSVAFIMYFVSPLRLQSGSCAARHVLMPQLSAPIAGGFDLSNPTRLRNAHTGPILTLALTDM